jgi:hypothetical protein
MSLKPHPRTRLLLWVVLAAPRVQLAQVGLLVSAQAVVARTAFQAQ